MKSSVRISAAIEEKQRVYDDLLKGSDIPEEKTELWQKVSNIYLMSAILKDSEHCVQYCHLTNPKNMKSPHN